MAIIHNPLDQPGITPKGEKWKLMPIPERDLDTVYWDLRKYTGANKTERSPK